MENSVRIHHLETSAAPAQHPIINQRSSTSSASKILVERLVGNILEWLCGPVEITGSFCSVFRARTYLEQVILSGPFLAHAHRTLASLYAILRGEQRLEDGLRWLVDQM